MRIRREYPRGGMVLIRLVLGPEHENAADHSTTIGRTPLADLNE